MHARTSPARPVGHNELSPARAKARVLRHLNEIHERERAAVPEIKAQIKATPGSDYGEELQRYLEETRRHTALVDERLHALGYETGTAGRLASFFQGAMARADARLLTPLDLIRPRHADDRVLERARHVAAVQASDIAGYRTLERLAAAAGDPDTEALAARLGEQEQQTFDRILGKLQTLADTLD